MTTREIVLIEDNNADVILVNKALPKRASIIK